MLPGFVGTAETAIVFGAPGLKSPRPKIQKRGKVGYFGWMGSIPFSQFQEPVLLDYTRLKSNLANPYNQQPAKKKGSIQGGVFLTLLTSHGIAKTSDKVSQAHLTIL